MGRPLVFEILDKPATSCFIGICSAIWFYIQKKNIGYSHVGLSYETAVTRHHWRIITSAFSHISMKAVSKLVKNDSSVHQRPVRHSVVFEVATKKPDSAVKRDRQAEKMRIYDKSQKSEIKTRMNFLQPNCNQSQRIASVRGLQGITLITINFKFLSQHFFLLHFLKKTFIQYILIWSLIA
ncbi:unnamed protein product [Malus baccata var. baccata]